MSPSEGSCNISVKLIRVRYTKLSLKSGIEPGPLRFYQERKTEDRNSPRRAKKGVPQRAMGQSPSWL